MAQRAILTITKPFRADGETSVDITINSRLEVYTLSSGVYTGCIAGASNPTEVRVGESYSFSFTANDNYYFTGASDITPKNLTISNAQVSTNKKTLTFTGTVTESAVNGEVGFAAVKATQYVQRTIDLDIERADEWENVSSQDISLSNPINFYADDDPITIEFTANTHYVINSITAWTTDGTALVEGTDWDREISSDGQTCTVTIYPSCDKGITLGISCQKVTYSVRVIDSNGKIKLISPTTVEAGYDGNIQIIIEIPDENGSISDYGFPTNVGQSNINGATFVSFVEE